LGVTALITVLSVMNGFEQELRERILGMAAHGTISGYGGGLRNWTTVAEAAERHPRIVGVAPYIRAEAMLTHGQSVHGSIIRGVLPAEEPRVSRVTDNMNSGSLDTLKSGSYNIILGKDLARTLGVGTGDRVTLVAPQARVTPAGILPRLRRFTVSGIFEVGMHEFDSALALIHMQDAARLFRLKDKVTGIRLRLDDMFLAPRISRELAEELPGAYWVTDWTQHHANFFRAIKTEKTVMFVILALIVAVAAFNIVSTLIMVVTDKESDIAILRTLGISPAGVMRIFMVQGSVIGVIGTLLGAIGGVALALNVETIVPAIESLLGLKFLSPDVYYISDLPSELHWPDVGRICGVALVLSLVATIYPAWRASRTQPAEALRYE
ncbi:MAG: lipoprotein-releasing ABC transporter permease subunit, partial [Gammaproteobacteria bacterium]|nr:lipoprotein-releasing ABC transporter permease subunit [Gammaproteobacteria bacterium]